MSTIVSFIGLFVLIYTQDVGYQVLFPHFDITPHHDSIIAYPKTQRITGTGSDEWPVKGEYDVKGVTWEYVEVKKEYITFSGSSDGVPDKLPASPNSPAPPHLSCCCTALKPASAGGRGIKDEYKDPDLPEADKKGAQVMVTRGSASAVVNPPLDPQGRIDTHISMTTSDTVGITIEGTKGGSKKVMTFNPAATITFGNTPLCVLEENCADNQHPDDGPGDFAAYYSMAVQSNTCKGTPSTCQQCAVSTVSPVPCTSSDCPNTTAAFKSAKKAMSMKKMKHTPSPQQVDLMMTIDCSNSQWP